MKHLFHNEVAAFHFTPSRVVLLCQCPSHLAALDSRCPSHLAGEQGQKEHHTREEGHHGRDGQGLSRR